MAFEARTISLAAISTALVCVATIVFTVYVPATRGYFNLGEAMVYTVALLLGPYIGAFAGGVGSALADILLGYLHYAPATLVIKGCEGFIVGVVAARLYDLKIEKTKWFAPTLAVGAGVAVAAIGAASQIVLAKLGQMQEVSLTFWLVLGAITAIALAITLLKIDPSLTPAAAATLLGGAEMICGYLLYEFWLYRWGALAEIPVNVCQVLVGMLVAIPVYKSLRTVWRTGG